MINDHQFFESLVNLWLNNDNYLKSYKMFDKLNIPSDKLISATTLLNPPKVLALQKKFGSNKNESIYNYFPTTLGTAVHTSFEKLLKKKEINKLINNLNILHDYRNIVVNPRVKKDLDLNTEIPVYLEKRHYRKLNNYYITGQIDLLVDGVYWDIKTSTAFSYKYGVNTERYKLQGSIYRWIFQKLKIFDNNINYMNIIYIIKDWQKSKVDQPNYPQQPIFFHKVYLYSLEETQQIIEDKLNVFKKNISQLNVDDKQEYISQCSDEELWIKNTYKVYKDQNAYHENKRCKKAFDNLEEAQQYNYEINGYLALIKSPPRACEYCSVSSFCQQYNSLRNNTVI